jgi:hypothetical protein
MTAAAASNSIANKFSDESVGWFGVGMQAAKRRHRSAFSRK